MKDLLLLAVVAAVFVFGWYLAVKLDDFWEESRQAQAEQRQDE